MTIYAMTPCESTNCKKKLVLDFEITAIWRKICVPIFEDAYCRIVYPDDL